MKGNNGKGMIGNGGSSAFRAGGRGSFNTTTFNSGRAKTVAASWAEVQMEAIKPEPLWATGVQNELLLTRPRNSVARIKTSIRHRCSSPENYPVQLQQRPASAMSMQESQRSFEDYGHQMSRSVTPFESTDLKHRRQLNIDHLQLSSKAHYRAYPLTRSSTPALYEKHLRASTGTPQPGDYPMEQEDAARIHCVRPAGRKLGLNYDFDCDSAPPGPQAQAEQLPASGAFRSVPVWPNYLTDLERHRMTPGCTKFVPSRRFVDFVSRSSAALEARAAAPPNPREHTAHFSATSRAAAPAGRPFHMKVAYNGAGTAYSHFNTLGRKEWEDWHAQAMGSPPPQ